jgi:long-chain acyl-CoA synthetase
MSRANLLSLFDQFSDIGHDTAVIQMRGYRRERFTYAELRANALLLSQILASHSIGPGDRVLLWGPNSFEWVACFWAILLRGAVVVPMDAGSTVEFVQRVKRDSQVKLILRDSAQPEVPSGPRNVVYNSLPIAPRADGTVYPQIGRADFAEILFTSGTTSEPRGVVLSHGNFLANLEPLETGIDEYRKYERWVHPLRFVSAVPLSHVFGQFMGIFVPPLLGATIVFENSALPTDTLRSIQQERATALIVVPRMLDAVRTSLEQLIDSRGWRKSFSAAYSSAKGEPFLRRVWRFRRLHSHLGWKFWAFISGGAALSPVTEEFFKRIGYAVVQGYGMTETASLISLNHPFRATEGSVGQVLPGREFRLSEDGEILVRGENVSSGYWEKGELRSAADNGWLHTGDLGELDAAGNLRFRGRKKNVIVTSAGLNVYPEDLEAALRKQPAIRDVVVIPLDISGNAEPCAVLLLTPSVISPSREGSEARNLSSIATQEQDRAAINAANSSLAEYQRIRRWLVWPEPDFPRTPTGKPRLAAIASQVATLIMPSNQPVIPPVLSDREGSEARDVLSSSTSSTSSTSFTSLRSLPSNLADLSSLDRVELLSSLEHRYNVELNETEFANAKSAADIQQLLAQPSARRSDFVYPRWTQRAHTRCLRLLIYYALAWPATLILAHPRIRGREHLAALKGPALFIANHTTRKADIGMVLYGLPPRFRHHLATAMGGETLQEFRQPPSEWFFAKRWLWQISYFLLVLIFNVFPLPRFSGFRQSFRFAGETVDRGYSLLVFPEGIINDRDSPAMAPFQSGIGLLAQNLGISIVPMRMDGVWKMKQQHRRLARFGELTIHIGAPVIFPPDTPPAEIASQLQRLVESL